MSRHRFAAARVALAGAALILAAGATPVVAQAVSGHLFEDRDGDGALDPNEPSLTGLPVRLLGMEDAGGSFDQTVMTGPAGEFSFSAAAGCFLLAPEVPPGWRLSDTRADLLPPSTPGYQFPVGLPRFSALQQLLPHLDGGQLRLATMGDSIGRNFEICDLGKTFWYSNQFLSRLSCVAPAATLAFEGVAQLGDETDDLLDPVNTGDGNDVFHFIGPAGSPVDLLTISIIGNDLLDVDPGSSPTQAQVNLAVEEVLDARQNLQEILSSLTSELPSTEIMLNTLYDNEAYNCSPGTFHQQWIPIIDRILREAAWGQARRVAVNEVAAEFAQKDLGGSCTGFTGMICRDFLGLDNIHPNNSGYTVIREKVWEASGGVNLGTRDALGRTSIPGIDYGLLRLVRRLSPTAWEARDGAVVTSPAAALDGDDAGAAASIRLGIGTEEVRFSGFPDWYDEIQIVRLVAGVRYKTAGLVDTDYYRMEASLTDQFRAPPGFSYSPTAWNFYTPIVGGGGPGVPAGNPGAASPSVLVVPNVAAYREVTATVGKDPVIAPGGASYEWPAPDHADLATATLRVAAAPVAASTGADDYTVELDHAWLDLYGWEKPRPAEAGGLDVDRLPDGTLELTFDPVAGATRYNIYTGRMATLSGGSYDHGAAAPAGPFCDAATQDAGGGRLLSSLAAAQQPAGDLYILITAHVDDVESPAGHRSDATEIDRSQSVCR